MNEASPEAAPVAPRAARRRAGLRWAIGLAVAASVWTAGIGWALPTWLRPRIEAAATEALGTPVTLQTLTVQPWTLQVVAEDLRIASPAGGPADTAPALFTLARAEARLSPQSLWRLAPVLHSLTLTAPELHVERWTRHRFNLSPVLDHLSRRPAAPDDGSSATFALHNIRVEDGAVRYRDRVLDQRHAVDGLRLGVPFISNLASDLDTEVEPLLEGRLDGSPFKLSGDTKPFAPGRPTELALQWPGVPLAPLATAVKPLLPPNARVDLAQGTLDAALTLHFEAPAAQPARLAVRGRVALKDIDARWPTGGWAGQFSSLVLDGLDIAPLNRQAHVGTVAWEGLRIQQGRPAAPVQSTPPTAPTPPTTGAPASAAWAWSVGRVQVSAPALQLNAPGDRPLPALGPVQLAIDGLDGRPRAAPARLHLTAADAGGSHLTVEGTLQPAARQATLTLDLQDGAPLPWLQALPLDLPAQLTPGRLALRARLALDAAALQLDEGSLQVTDLRASPLASTARGPAEKGRPMDPKRPTPMADTAVDRLELPSLGVTGVAARWQWGTAEQPSGLVRLDIAQVLADRLNAAASRDSQGAWRWIGGSTKPAAQPTQEQPAAVQARPPAASASATPSTASAPASAPTAAPASAPAATPAPTIRVASVRCQGCALQFHDGTVSPASTWRLTDLQLAVQNVSGDLAAPLGIDLATRAQGNGRLSFKGTVRPAPLAVAGQLQAQAVDLQAVQPYLAPLVNLTLLSAQAHAQGQVTVDKSPAGALAVRWRGGAALADLRTQDNITGNELLRWRSLALEGSDIAWRSDGNPQQPALKAELGRVALDDFFGRLIVHPDGHLNLRDIRKEVAGTRSLTTPEPPASAAGSSREPAPATSATARPLVSWQRIALSNGRLDFTDNFVKPNYSARLQRLVGEVSALGMSDTAEPAQISLAGSLDEGAPVTVNGRVQPFGARLFADVQGSATGIELTRLSTYAERYAGYAIDKGSLNATVRYRVQDGRLEASNRVFLDQLTFGDKVDSPTATQLPVLLAVALLKNSRGEIDVELPVAGSLDDPQFSVGGVILRVLGNLLVRAVTSPFSLLASAAQGLTGGGGGEELGWVAFEPGSAQLTAAERTKLDALAGRLADRPALRLEASGRADADVDAQGLRQRQVARLLRAAKAQALGIDRRDAAAAEALQIAPEERDRWLREAYRAAEIRKPRNFIGMARDLPPAEMEALLMAEADTGPQALQALADRRADRVNAYLDGKLGADRVRLSRSVVRLPGSPPDKAPTGAPASRVQFELR